MQLLWGSVVVTIFGCFCFFVGMGCADVSPSHVWLVSWFGFLVWAVFLVLLGWGKHGGYAGWAGMGWDGINII